MSTSQIRKDIFTLLIASIEVEFIDAVASGDRQTIHKGVQIPETPINYKFNIVSGKRNDLQPIHRKPILAAKENREVLLHQFQIEGPYREGVSKGYNRIATSLNGLIGQPTNLKKIEDTAHMLSEALGKKVSVRPASMDWSRIWKPQGASSLEIIVSAAKRSNPYTNPVLRALEQEPPLQITGYGIPLSHFNNP